MKKVFSILLTLTLFLGLLPAAAFSSAAEESAAKADLEIGTYEQMKAFLTSTDDYEGKLVVLTADIDMKSERYDIAKRSFAGTFDGQGHTITNWWANNNVDHGYGLFGYVQEGKTATVKNLVILNSTYRVLKWQVGGIFGNVHGTANIDNVYSELRIGYDWAPGGDVGGFVGKVMKATSVVNITNSVYAGVIDNNSNNNGHFAGFVGTIQDAAATVNITNCAYYGTMSNPTSRNAGFASCVKGKLNVTDSVYAGTINRTDKKATYFEGTTYATTTLSLTNCLYASQVGYQEPTASGATKLAKNALIGDNASATITTHKLSGWSKAYGYLLPTTLNTMLGADFKGAGSPALSSDHWYTIETNDETPETLVIDSVEDLLAFSEALNHADINFEGLTVEITCDLDLNPGWTVGSENKPTNVWKLTECGRTFAGTIDGKGHTIRSIYMVAADGANDVGFFGSAASATVKDLAVVNSYVESNGHSHGGLFGGVSGTTVVSNCYVDIALVNHYTSLSANGDLGVGGIAGAVTTDSYMTIENTVFVGSIEITKDMGQGGIRGVDGFVGVVNGSNEEKNALTLKNCGYFGSINSKRNVAGGLVGAMGNFDDKPLVSVENCIVAGVIYTDDCDWNGSFCGYIMSGTLTVSGSYYIKLNDAGVMVDRPAFGSVSAFATYEGCTLVSDLSLRGTSAAAFLTEKGLSAWQASAGYVMPTALADLLPAALPGEGDVANDELPKEEEPTETFTEAPTEAPTAPSAPSGNGTSATEPTENNGGCASSVRGTILPICIAVAALCAMLGKAHKKED